MQRETLDYNMLLEKTRETGLVFSNLLGGAVLEEIVRRIGESEYSKSLWLKNGSILGKEQYEKNLTLNLEYDYVIQKLPKSDEGKSDAECLTELTDKLKQEIFEDSKDDGIIFQVRTRKIKNDMQLNIEASIEKMKVPVNIRIRVLRDEKLIPRKESLSLMLFPEINVNYYSYPAESLIAEKFMEIIIRLELIQDMRAYYDIYYLLERESVDGRRVRELIAEQCIQKNISREKSRIDAVEGYRNYSYMKKKWKVFLRSVNQSEPEWNTVIERFLKFFGPIWKAITEDVVFFGDWMPDLNRFL